jgi:glycosyltransferase involved in cell wall biosynthesis
MSSTTEGIRLSVVVPVYQEAATIQTAIERIVEELDLRSLPYEVIVVSDGSTDDSARLVRDLHLEQVHVVEYSPNRGKGHAVKVGFQSSHGDLIAMIDGDLDIHPSGIGRLLDRLDPQTDAILGSKVHPESEVFYPGFRRFQSRVFRRIVRMLFRLDVTDTQTGLKLFRRDVLETCLPHVESPGFLFDMELLVLANERGYVLREGPVDIDYQFSTSTGTSAVLRMLVDLVRLKRRMRSAGSSMTVGVTYAPTPPRPETHR